MKNPANACGVILDIDHFAVHDGPGIRTCIYLKGCPMRCAWCHSPESQKRKPEILYAPARCLACGQCTAVCPQGLHSMEGGQHRFTGRESCTGCGACVRVCAPQAMFMCGRFMTAEAVAAEAVADSPFFACTGGGVTLSGGEVLGQANFALQILMGIKAAGVHTIVETAGMGARAALLSLAPYTDTFYYDMKLCDPGALRRWTGGDHALILANLRALRRLTDAIVLRVPLIPGITDTDDNILSIYALACNLRIRTVHLLPYNHMAGAKYAWVDTTYSLEGLKTSPGRCEALLHKAPIELEVRLMESTAKREEAPAIHARTEYKRKGTYHMPLTRTPSYSEVFSREGNRLLRNFDAETLWIEPWGDNSLRVRATKLAQMPDADWALLPQAQAQTEAVIEIGQDCATLTHGNIRAIVSRAGKLTIENAEGKVLLEEYVRNRSDINASYCSALDIEAREFMPILGSNYALTFRLESDPDERVYGMGQYQMDILNLKGCELELAQRNSQASVPFCVSSRGYGFLWNNPAVGRVCFGRNITTWVARSTNTLDFWITAADTPAEIAHSYAKATGFAPMMPSYGMGFWQCKLRYSTQEELLAVAREYKRRNLPISVIVADFFHWPHQGDWKFDPEYWPNPEEMVRELAEMGIELMVSIWPTVDGHSENYAYMLQKGYLIQVDRGMRIAMDFVDNTIHFDATNPGARDFVWRTAKRNYYDKGIRLFWLDEAEPEYGRYDFDLYRYHAGPNLQIGNLYPTLYAKAFYDGMRASGQEEVVNLLRCAWAGSQRYGALVWSGDIHSSFHALRCQLVAGLNMGMAGIPWWTTDIGGFHGGNPDDPAFRELLIRWFQYGAFCPVMRLHGMREPERPPIGPTGGGRCLSGADNEVWSYGEEAYEILRQHLFLRERMRPYVTRLMEEAHTQGAPVMRTMFYAYPGDPLAWSVEDQYMFGPDILVAPVLHAGQRQRDVYLPKGTDWIEAVSGKRHAGGQTITANAPLHHIPVFQRADITLEFSWTDDD